MARKIAKRTVRLKHAASDDESVRSTGGPNAIGSGEPQKETETVVIPDGGEIQLQNSNILPNSVSVSELKTDVEFTTSDDQTFGPGKFFFLPEESTIFFDPADAGRRVEIEYLWKEEGEEGAEADEDEKEDDEETPELGEDGEEKEKKTRTKAAPGEGLWDLDSEWFKWKPLSKKITVNNSLHAKLDKGVDLRRGIKVTNEKTGKELRLVLSGADKAGNPKRQPAPGEVVYNYGNGHLYWGDSAASGNTYDVEYYMRGQLGEKVTMAGEENEEKEYQLLESFKSRAENLWTNLLDNPDPGFVQDTLLPVVEDEIDSLREKALAQKSETQKEQDLKNVPDLTGEFIELEQLLAKREENDNEENRSLARDFIESDIAPKLSRFYSLASLLSERAYDMQTSSEKDEDFPEFGTSGARALDLSTLKYLKRVRQEANKLDEDLVDFSKYYTGQLIQWIRDPDTYYPPTSKPTGKKSKKDARWPRIKEIFEQAGVGLADLQAVALEAFRRAILEFDRDKRDKTLIPDPKKFRVFANPLVKRRVQNALKRLFDKYQVEQTVEATPRSGTEKVVIPENGVVDLNVSNLRVEDLEIRNKAGELFTSANGRLMTPTDEGRKSNRVKILLGGRKNESDQVSVTVPETGEKLSIIRSKDAPWNAELKKRIAEDPKVFFLALSSGTIWLSDTYRGKPLLVEAPGLSSDGGTIGKNQYRVYPTKGTIEFSPENAGDEVEIQYTSTVRSKRHVNPVISDEEGNSTSLIDMKEEEGADPEALAEEAVSQENVDKLLEVIGEILEVEEDPRLTEEDRVILSGLLGIGEPGGQRLTIQEIAAREPFNVDVSDANKVNQIKAKRQKAANTLIEILREKASEDPSLRKMVRPMEGILMGKDVGTIDTDKFLGYLQKAPENKGAAFQRVLVGILGKAGLKQDEENILRWMWALPGKLRRDQDSEEKKYDELPNGVGPAKSPGPRLQEIAIDEFGIEVDDEGNISPAATSVVGKVYSRALDKFAATFNQLYDARTDFFQGKFPEFVQYYNRQRGKQNLRDELAQIDQSETQAPAVVPSPKAKEKEKAEPLYDQLKRSLSGVDEGTLRSLMEELLAAHKKGGSISDLIRDRQKDLDAVTARGADYLEQKTKAIREELQSLSKAIGQTQDQLSDLKEEGRNAVKERNSLMEKAVTETDDEGARNALQAKEKEIRIMSEILAAIKGGSVRDLLSPRKIQSLEDPREKEIFETFSYLRDADGDDLTDAKDDLAAEIAEKREEATEMKKKIISLANADLRSEMTKLKQKIKDLRARNSKFQELLATQQAEEDAKRDALKKQLGPLQKKVEEHLKDHSATKELKTLERVKNYLDDREELQRGDGSYALDNMFEVAKPDKAKPYQPPKLAPGESEGPAFGPGTEEDERQPYQPLPRDEVGPVNVVRKKPSGLPEPGAEVAPPKGKTQREKKEPSPAAEEERVKFQPKTREAPAAETQRSLFDELRAAAVPIDPEETRESYHTRVKNFRLLMDALRQHFAAGKSIKEFRPKFSASQTLPDQNRILRSVLEYLRDYGSDLKKAPGVWDLKNLFNPTIVKPVESLEKKPDLSTEEKAVESLVNAQPSLEDNKVMARVLHQAMERINQGEPMKKILKGLIGESKNTVLRLDYFMSLHEDLKKTDGTWDWSSLYTGKSQFPAKEEFNRSRPIENQMGPLVRGIQKILQEEAGPGGGIESVSGTEQRVLDMLHQMSELALHGMDLEQMEAHFDKEDKRGSRPYSVAYLFQQVRNYLSRLNRTQGLSNSRNDLGLGKVFGPGAPAGTPTEQDEVQPQDQKQLTPLDDRTTGFRQMVESMGMSEKEARAAHNLVQSLQLHMEKGEKTAAELLSALLQKKPQYAPVAKKLLSYIGKNRNLFGSGVVGVPDFSSLTGMPFRHPALETKAPEPERPATEAVPPVQEVLQKPVEPVAGEDKTKLRKSIFQDFVEEYGLDDDQKNLFADALRLLKTETIGADMAAEGVRGAIERLVSYTKDTPFDGVFELLIEFFKEKGLVASGGLLPDFRGVTVPALGSRESFFKRNGKPNLEKMQEEEVSTDDISAEMPEPRADVAEEQAEDLAEEISGPRGRLSPELQDAVDFLKSDQTVTEEGKPRDTAKERLKKNIWSMMVQEFDFDAEEQQNAAEILETVQKEGLPKVKAKLKGKGHAEVLLDDLVDYIKEQGLSVEDIPDIQLPEISSGEDSNDPVGVSIEEMMEEKPQPKREEAPNRLAPTIRREVDEETLRKTLDAAQRAQGKGPGAHLFDVAEVVRGLEGKVSPEDAKNALLQAMDSRLIELNPESGRNSLSEDDVKFIPVGADGVPLSSGRVLKMPEPKAAPTPAAPARAPEGEGKGPGTRGRLPKELQNRPTGKRVFNFISSHANLTTEDKALLGQELPEIENMTYRQLALALKDRTFSEGAKNAITRYGKGLTAFLRLIQQGKNPLSEGMATAPPQREKGVWREDAPTERQVAKIQELAEGLKAQGHEVEVNLEPKTKGEASDIINSLKALLGEQPKTAPAPRPAPAPQPVQKRPPPAGANERARLKALADKALEWSTANDVSSAAAFKVLLRKKGRPELIPLYEKVMPEVQKALDAIHSNELDFDLSGL